MRYTLYLLIFTIFFGCSKTKEIRAEKYFEHINNAEHATCHEDFEKSLSEYEMALE